MSKLGLITLTVLWIFSPLILAERCMEGGNNCTLGVFPHTSIRQLETTYASLTQDLTLQLDVPVRVITSSSMGIYEDNLNQGVYDIALAGPQQYVSFAAPAGYLPIARRNNYFRFMIAVLNDSNIREISDLAGKTLGLVTPSIKRHVFAAKMLYDADRNLSDKVVHKHFSNQRACVHALESKLVDSCGVISTIFHIITDQSKNNFRILGESIDVPNAVYVVHPDVTPEQRELLTEYLTDRPNYVAAKDSDYDGVRQLKSSLAQ